MMKMDADVVVTSLGDLDNFYIKRSYIRKDIEYVYMPHHMTSMTLTSTRGEYTNYDAVLCVGQHQIDDARAVEEYYDTKRKKLPAIGYDLLDREIADYEAMDKTIHDRPEVLIAPTWNLDNILDSCIDDMLVQLLGHGYHVTVRPHPEYKKRYQARLDALVERYRDVPAEDLTFELDFSGQSSILEADILVTDWSTIAEEFSFTTLKPCIFINTTMKVRNPEWQRLTSWLPMDISIRDEIGRSLEPDDLSDMREVVEDMVQNPDRWREEIRQVRERSIFNLGHGGEKAGEFLLGEILAQQDKKKGAKKGDVVAEKGGAHYAK